MTQRFWFTLCTTLALICLVGTVVALQPADVEVPMPDEAAPELDRMLAVEEPLMSVDRKATQAAAPDLLAPDTSWYRGICWTSCFPCNSDADCAFIGETCRFNVICP